MKQIFIFILFAVAATACQRKSALSSTIIKNNTIKNEDGDTILAGHCSINILQQKPYKIWYDTNYTNYKVDTPRALLLTDILKGKTIEIFLGTWCGDSRREVPRMLKVLQVAQMDTNNIKLIFVDNSQSTYKQSPEGEQQNKNIHRVPTFILYDAKEMGRIVETPLESFERDLATIACNVPYTPKYKAIDFWLNEVSQKDKPMKEKKLAMIAREMKPLCRHAGELNTYGYVLIGQKKYEQALNIFKINCNINPTNANVFDSLAETYILMKDKARAKENYEKCLQLNPKSENARKMLERIEKM